MKIYQQILNVDTIPNWSRKQNSKNIFEEIINLVLGITKHGKHPKHKPSAKGWGAGKLLLLWIIKIFFPTAPAPAPTSAPALTLTIGQILFSPTN